MLRPMDDFFLSLQLFWLFSLPNSLFLSLFSRILSTTFSGFEMRFRSLSLSLLPHLLDNVLWFWNAFSFSLSISQSYCVHTLTLWNWVCMGNLPWPECVCVCCRCHLLFPAVSWYFTIHLWINLREGIRNWHAFFANFRFDFVWFYCCCCFCHRHRCVWRLVGFDIDTSQASDNAFHVGWRLPIKTISHFQCDNQYCVTDYVTKPNANAQCNQRLIRTENHHWQLKKQLKHSHTRKHITTIKTK